MARDASRNLFSLAAHLRTALARRLAPARNEAESRLRAAASRGESDQVRDPAEQFYASLYLDGIARALPARADLRILDAGCQAGRLAIPLARQGHRVTGIDLSERWLAQCRRHCADEGVTVDLVQGDMREVLQRFEDASFDAILCVEVLYTIRNPQDVLAAMTRLLKPDGVLVTSHRTRYYMLTTLARYHRLSDMAVVAHGSEGMILDEQYYNWFTGDELRELYARAGLRIRSIEGVGAVSGTGVDGMAAVIDPGELEAGERAALLEIERACAARFRDIARYQLVVAEIDLQGRP